MASYETLDLNGNTLHVVRDRNEKTGELYYPYYVYVGKHVIIEAELCQFKAFFENTSADPAFKNTLDLNHLLSLTIAKPDILNEDSLNLLNIVTKAVAFDRIDVTLTERKNLADKLIGKLKPQSATSSRLLLTTNFYGGDQTQTDQIGKFIQSIQKKLGNTRNSDLIQVASEFKQKSNSILIPVDFKFIEAMHLQLLDDFESIFNAYMFELEDSYEYSEDSYDNYIYEGEDNIDSTATEYPDSFTPSSFPQTGFTSQFASPYAIESEIGVTRLETVDDKVEIDVSLENKSSLFSKWLTRRHRFSSVTVYFKNKRKPIEFTSKNKDRSSDDLTVMTLTLPPGTGLNDVSKIKGNTFIYLPQNIKSQIISQEDLNKSIQFGNHLVFLHKMEKSKATYYLRSEIKELLEVRPLNKDKQVLNTGSSSRRSQRAYGKRREYIEMDVSGAVHFLEFIHFTHNEKFEFDFEFKLPVHCNSALSSPINEKSLTSLKTYEALRKDRFSESTGTWSRLPIDDFWDGDLKKQPCVSLGPFDCYFKEIRRWMGDTTRFDLIIKAPYEPYDRYFIDIKRILRLRLKYVRGESGLLYESTSPTKKMHDVVFDNRRESCHSECNISIPGSINQSEVESFTLEAHINMPNRINRHKVPNITIGETFKAGGISFTATHFKAGAYYLDADRSLTDLITVGGYKSTEQEAYTCQHRIINDTQIWVQTLAADEGYLFIFAEDAHHEVIEVECPVTLLEEA